MNKPFQFSMRRMVAAMTWLCVAAACASVVYQHRYDHDGFLYLWLYFAAFIAAGTGVGSIFGKVMAGVGIAIWCGCVLLVVLMLLDGVREG